MRKRETKNYKKKERKEYSIGRTLKWWARARSLAAAAIAAIFSGCFSQAASLDRRRN